MHLCIYCVMVKGVKGDDVTAMAHAIAAGNQLAIAEISRRGVLVDDRAETLFAHMQECHAEQLALLNRARNAQLN
jgi:hypothetical protein